MKLVDKNGSPTYYVAANTNFHYDPTEPTRCTLHYTNNVMSVDEAGDFIGFADDLIHEENQEVVLELKFDLPKILEEMQQDHHMGNGIIELQAKPKFDAMRAELVDMIASIDAMQYGATA